MKKPFFLKIFAGYFTIIFIISFLILILSFSTIRKYYIKTTTLNLKSIAHTLVLSVKPIIEEKNIKKLDILVEKLGANIQSRITVIDADGIVLADSEENPLRMENHSNRPEIMNSLNEEFGSSIRYSTTVKEDMLYVALSIKNRERLIGYVRLSLFLKDINILLANLKSKIIYITLISALIAIFIAIIISRNIIKPIKEMADSARVVASGDFNVRILSKSNDELKELADSFNYMTERIGKLFSDLKFQKDKVDGIIKSLKQGLLVIDNTGAIILANESFKEITGDKRIKGKNYWDVLRSPGFNEIMKKTGQGNENITDEIELNGRNYLCSANQTQSGKEIVIIMHDITETKNLEKIKKDFIVNVSHELRTPLTAINGFVETLEEEADKKHSHHIGIIKRHTKRLINIVKDLQLLSKLEDTSAELNIEKVDLSELLDNIVQLFRKRAEDKGIDLKIEKEDIKIMADSFKLEQLLINLVDNAVKYTEKGYIKIAIEKVDDRVRIIIEDTGIGIPEKDINRIYERFYVVDKSRTKELGGTGLGLSIVKHIVQLHRGDIKIESTLGTGTSFTVILPNKLS